MERFVETTVALGLIPGFLFGYRVYETMEEDLSKDVHEGIGRCTAYEDHVLYIGFIDICITIKRYELWP